MNDSYENWILSEYPIETLEAIKTREQQWVIDDKEKIKVYGYGYGLDIFNLVSHYNKLDRSHNGIGTSC